MALIICPECGKEISEKAVACIHFGFPLSELKNMKNNVKDINEILPRPEIYENITCNHCGIGRNKAKVVCVRCGYRFKPGFK